MRRKIRGLYVLLKEQGDDQYRVVYVGRSCGETGGIHGRIGRHTRSKSKNSNPQLKWTHFSFYEVWDNITEAEICELEGLLRHVYRKDREVNVLNRQRSHKPFYKIRMNNLRKW